jgi:hypothetical protein
LWEPIKNLKGTSWEHIRKQGKLKKNLPYPPLTWALLLVKKKINLLPSLPKTQIKKLGCLKDVTPSHWLYAISIFKIVSYLFGLS